MTEEAEVPYHKLRSPLNIEFLSVLPTSTRSPGTVVDISQTTTLIIIIYEAEDGDPIGTTAKTVPLSH